MPLLLAMLCLFTSFAARAVPVDLSTATYATAAFAELGDTSDGVHSASSPPDPLSLASHALLENDGGDRAAADAVADTGLIAVSTDLAAALATTSALADASLHTDIDTPGSYVLNLLFEQTLSQSGLGTVNAMLGLTLDVGGTLVFDESFAAGASIERLFTVLPGQLAVLDLHLQSLADAMQGGDGAFALASVTATLDRDVRPVPTPGTAVLMAAGLVPLVRLMSRRRGIACA